MLNPHAEQSTCKAEHGQRPGRARPSGLGWQPGLLARLPGDPGDLDPSTPPTRGGVRRRCRLSAQGPGCTAKCTSICRTEQAAASSLPLYTSASAQYSKRGCPNKTFGSFTDRVPIARSEGRHAPRGEAHTLATITLATRRLDSVDDNPGCGCCCADSASMHPTGRVSCTARAAASPG
jgi:hypothetical protein